MPTQTFFNLPEEKQEKLMDAIRSELSRVSFHEVSINQIVRSAEISRGSFYQYFKNKQDMLQYVLSDYRIMLKRCALESLKETNGDLFQMFLAVVDSTYAFVTEGNNTFFKNIFSDIRVNAELVHQIISGKNSWEYAKQLMPYIDMGLLDIRNQEDFDNMLGIILPLTGQTFVHIFFDISDYDNSRSQYAARLELLKRGFQKNKEVCS